MMTKKDYILIAKAIAKTDKQMANDSKKINEIKPYYGIETDYRNTLLQNLADTFKEDNWRFDSKKFLKFIENAK